MKTFGLTLKALLDARGIRAGVFAQHAGLSESQVSHMINGKSYGEETVGKAVLAFDDTTDRIELMKAFLEDCMRSTGTFVDGALSPGSIPPKLVPLFERLSEKIAEDEEFLNVLRFLARP